MISLSNSSYYYQSSVLRALKFAGISTLPGFHSDIHRLGAIKVKASNITALSLEYAFDSFNSILAMLSD
jgi:hypothetical protein